MMMKWLSAPIAAYVNDKGRWNLAASKASRKVIAWMYRDGKPLPYGENKDEFEEG